MFSFYTIQVLQLTSATWGLKTKLLFFWYQRDDSEEALADVINTAERENIIVFLPKAELEHVIKVVSTPELG